MLATAIYRGIDPTGYERPEHAVQEEIRRVLSEICGVPLDRHDMGIDGCSVPTFALPLAALAMGFARLGSGKGLTGARKDAAERLVSACIASPELVAGEGRFDTVVMRGLGSKVFSKGGAEGVHCASLPALGLGIARQDRRRRQARRRARPGAAPGRVGSRRRSGAEGQTRRRTAELARGQGGPAPPEPDARNRREKPFPGKRIALAASSPR